MTAQRASWKEIFLSGVRSLHPFKVRQCGGGGGAELEDTPHDSAEISVEGISSPGPLSPSFQGEAVWGGGGQGRA